MKSRLKIIHDSTSFTNRPPISFKVVEYLENYINENLLKIKNIITNGNWEIHLVLTFYQESKRYKSDDIFIPSTPPRIVKENKVKIYEALVPMKLINNSQHPYLTTIELIFDAVKIFLTRNYKKISSQDMDSIWKGLNFEYLLSLPYPAPVSDQKYLTDVVLPSGEIGSAIQWSETLKVDHSKKP